MHDEKTFQAQVVAAALSCHYVFNHLRNLVLIAKQMKKEIQKNFLIRDLCNIVVGSIGQNALH